jgi:hypothetical protein
MKNDFYAQLRNAIKTIETTSRFLCVSLELEYSVSDTNVYMDHNWLFSGEDPRQMIRSIHNEMFL